MIVSAVRGRWRDLGPTTQSLTLFLAALAIVGPWLPITLLTIFVFLLVYAAWAYSINLITGMTGYVSFGHVVFVGAGGYALGYGIRAWGIDPFIGVV